MTSSPNLTVRDVAAADHDAWTVLYSGYRAFYQQAIDDAAVERSWQWILRRDYGLRGVVVVDADDKPVALANVRLFARPSTGRLGLYLDDLFTSPESRGCGAASMLLRHIASLANDLDAGVVRWITAADNAAARSVYDGHATATNWVTYDMAPSMGDDR